MKKTGFSYVEVLAASALFLIILLGVLPLALGARQNLAYAQNNQRLSLAAGSLSLAVRDMVIAGSPVSDEAIENLALAFGVQNYSVFIFGPGGENRFGSPFHSSSEGQSMSLSGFGSLSAGISSSLIYVVIYSEHYTQAGRAISVAINHCHTTGIWRDARE